MNWDRVAGKWTESKGKVREQWGKLTDDDLDVIAGRRDQLVGLIQRRYGMARDEVERQVKQFEEKWKTEAEVDAQSDTRPIR